VQARVAHPEAAGSFVVAELELVRDATATLAVDAGSAARPKTESSRLITINEADRMSPLLRVAALYDIHGNLPALEAVLRDVHEAAVDHVVVGGDVLPGPLARETLERLLDLPCPVDFIYGNGDVAVLEQMAGRTPARVPEQYRPAMAWTAEGA
jgi:hypothetical protein